MFLDDVFAVKRSFENFSAGIEKEEEALLETIIFSAGNEENEEAGLEIIFDLLPISSIAVSMDILALDSRSIGDKDS